MKEIAAGGVVYKQTSDGFLVQIVQDRFGKITLAKGRMEQGETVEQTALREIKEETGIDGEIIKPLEVIYYSYKGSKEQTIDKEVHYFLVEAKQGNLEVQYEEIADVRWCTPEKAWALQLADGYENNDSVLQKALEHLGVKREGNSADGK